MVWKESLPCLGVELCGLDEKFTMSRGGIVWFGRKFTMSRGGIVWFGRKVYHV